MVWGYTRAAGTWAHGTAVAACARARGDSTRPGTAAARAQRARGTPASETNC